MARDALTLAEYLMGKRKFSKAISLLETRSDTYEGNFNYYVLFATAFLYQGDAGSASVYFGKAREIKLVDTNLLLGQAAIFLRRGETARAIQYYLEVLDGDPENKIAKDALEFIRTQGDYDTICRWVDDGRIEQFYPPLQKEKHYFAFLALVPVALCVFGITAVLLSRNSFPVSERADLSSLALSEAESSHPEEPGAEGRYKFELSSDEIKKSLSKAKRYFHSHRDNAAQVEINRLLNSNALPSIKQKARVLMTYLDEPTFDTVVDVPSYEEVAANIDLYLDCFAVWKGRVANVNANESRYSFDLLVGYETQKNVKGVVRVFFDSHPNVDSSRAVDVLGKIAIENGRLCLRGKAVYQTVNDLL